MGLGSGDIGPTQVDLLGLFSSLPVCPIAHRLTKTMDAAPPLHCSPEGRKTKGFYWCYSDGRWGSCPTVPYGELRLCMRLCLVPLKIPKISSATVISNV